MYQIFFVGRSTSSCDTPFMTTPTKNFYESIEDAASLARSVQIIVDPAENPASTREIVHQFIAAGATHLVLGPRTPNEGIAHWLSEAIIQPLCDAIGATFA
jgi:hypothetical protein